jgi:hypothetical protein
MTAAKGYKETSWKGHKNYECEQCPFKTLDKEAIGDHIRVVHGGVADEKTEGGSS